MQIQILLDMEDFDANEPVGEIRLSDEQNTITEPYTYIDSWIDGLTEAIKRLQNEKRVEINLIEEPTPLYFEKDESRVRISYGEAFIYVENTEEINSALNEAIANLRNSLEKDPILLHYSS